MEFLRRLSQGHSRVIRDTLVFLAQRVKQAALRPIEKRSNCSVVTLEAVDIVDLEK